jgi:hypothetical protein
LVHDVFAETEAAQNRATKARQIDQYFLTNPPI